MNLPNQMALIKNTLGSGQNDRNISMQHITTLLSATCCVRLAPMLRHVAMRCAMLGVVGSSFENGQIFDATFVDIA